MGTNSPKTQYEPGRIRGMIAFLAQRFNVDAGFLRAEIYTNFPEMCDKKSCANCGASMQSYVDTLDNLDASLVLAMAKVVQEKMRRGALFSEANRVHIQSELTGSYTIKSRTTQCSKLGLIAKVPKRDAEGKIVRKDGQIIHDQKAGWLITKRGYEFLGGKEVPKSVVSFRNEIKERSSELVTIKEAMLTPAEYLSVSEIGKELLPYAVGGVEQGRLL